MVTTETYEADDQKPQQSGKHLKCEQDDQMTRMIRNLNKVMDDLQREQLIVSGFNGTAEEKAEKERFH